MEEHHTCLAIHVSYFLLEPIQLFLRNKKKVIQLISHRILNWDNLLSRQILLYWRNPTLPSLRRPDSPYKHPDSHSVGSPQASQVGIVFKVLAVSCFKLANFKPSMKAFLSMVLKAVICLPLDWIVRPGIFETHAPLRHHWKIVVGKTDDCIV